MLIAMPDVGNVHEVSNEEAYKASLALTSAAIRFNDTTCGLLNVLDALSLREQAKEYRHG